MKKKMSNMLVALFLLVVVSFAFTLPIHSSDVQPVGEGEGSGLLGQHKSLQAYSHSEPPETEWNRTYGGASYDFAWSVVETGDGGYALAGGTRSFGAGGGDFWLVKIGRACFVTALTYISTIACARKIKSSDNQIK